MTGQHNPSPRRYNHLLTILFIVWGFFSVDWSSDLIHAGGVHTTRQLVQAFLHPDLSHETLQRAFHAVGVTISYAVAGMSVSIFLAFLMGVLASGLLFRVASHRHPVAQVVRNLLTFMRSIHELVWAWLFVASFGLHPLSAILALGIPYGGTLGRIFADMLSDVPHEPIKALESTGASQFQKLIYVYLPYALPNMVSYAMYRFECAIRASTVMSFVGLGGLGYEIQLSLNDLEYSQAFTYLFVLIGLILIIELWSNRLRLSQSIDKSRKLTVQKASMIIVFIGTLFAWAYIHMTEGIYLKDLLNEKNLAYTLKFIRGLLGFGESTPAFLQWEAWRSAILLSLETLQMSILAICIAGLLATLLAIPASKPKPVKKSGIISWTLDTFFYLLRGLFIFSRAIPELVWAMVLVFLFKPGPLPGVLALAIHNFGILGKLCAEVVENMDQRPLDSLRSSGAGLFQSLFYGVLPLTMPKFVTYILYRWEVIIRTTIIVGFVGAGGLGQAFKLSMSWFKYSEITLYLICYLLLIGSVDKIAQYLRTQMKP